MKQIHITTAAAKDADAKAQHLAIVLTDDGYSFCTASQAPYQIYEVLLAPYPKQWSALSPAEQWDYLKATHERLNKRYLQIKIACDSNKSTLLPTAVYQEGTGTDYFELVFGNVRNEQLHRDSLADLEVDFISAFPMGWQAASQLHFPSARLLSLNAALSQQFGRLARLEGSKQLFLSTTPNQLSVWAFDQQHLRAYNRFRAETPEDVLYYSQLLAQQLQWNDPSVQLLTKGEGAEKSIALLTQHFSEVRSLVENKAIAFDPQLSKLDAGTLQMLFACLCAS